MKMIHSGENFNPPTAKSRKMAKDKTDRLTNKKLRDLHKNKGLDSLTQDIKELYPVRV